MRARRCRREFDGLLGERQTIAAGSRRPRTKFGAARGHIEELRDFSNGMQFAFSPSKRNLWIL
jgi:hypothetical protein